MLLGYAHSKQQVDCVDIEEVTPAATLPRSLVRIVWSPFQPVHSVVYEGVLLQRKEPVCYESSIGVQLIGDRDRDLE